jgi:hypothetical protein
LHRQLRELMRGGRSGASREAAPSAPCLFGFNWATGFHPRTPHHFGMNEGSSVLALLFLTSFPWAGCLHGLGLQARRGAPRLVRLFPCLLALVPAMAFAGSSCMVLVMSLRIIVDIICTPKAHPWMGLLLAPVGVDRCAVSVFLQPALSNCWQPSTPVAECFRLLAPPFLRLKPA